MNANELGFVIVSLFVIVFAVVSYLDQDGLRATILYPSIGLTWECEIEDPELSLAYARAYNRWIVDFCSDSNGRLVPIAHISLADGQEAAKELEQSVKAGGEDRGAGVGGGLDRRGA